MKTPPAEVQLPGTLWGKFLRSPFPHAMIAHIDTSQAREVPGVHAVPEGSRLIAQGFRFCYTRPNL